MSIRRIRSTIATFALLTGAVRADITPDWTATLPFGSALQAGETAMVVDASGVTYVTGIAGPSFNVDILTAAFGPNGSLLWSRTYNGPANWHDQAAGIALGTDGLLYVTGNTPGPGSYANVLVLGYDRTTGDIVRTIQYSSGEGLSEFGSIVLTDAQGNLYVGGGTVGDGTDAMILKFDAAGTLLWKWTWDGPALAPYSQDQVYQLAFDPDGKLVVLVYGVMASMHPDYVVDKLSPADGSTIWETTWGTNADDSPRAMVLDPLGDIYVTGTTNGVSERFGTIKLRGSDGALLWQAFDQPAYHNFPVSLALDGQGGVYVTGRTDPDGDRSNQNDNIYTVKRDASTGAMLWSRLYGANCLYCFDAPGDVAVDAAGHVFVTGMTSSPPYSADAITLVLDAGTGLEVERGVVDGGTARSASGGFLGFDPSFGLLDAGETYEANTGETALLLLHYGALAGNPSLFCEPGSTLTMGCPCANPPSGAGRGCDNSSGTGGATLSVAGSASAASDTLAFTANAERSSALSVLLQGSLQIAGGAAYGQGIRCFGGTLKLLCQGVAASGTVTLPNIGAGDPRITARSAALGDPIAAGTSRYYLVYYRDPTVLGGCATWRTFNAGPSMRVDWRP